jgi:hypothetical protein
MSTSPSLHVSLSKRVENSQNTFYLVSNTQPTPTLPLKGREYSSSPFKGEARRGMGEMLGALLTVL